MLQGVNKSGSHAMVVDGVKTLQKEMRQTWEMNNPDGDPKERPCIYSSQFSFEQLHEVSLRSS